MSRILAVDYGRKRCGIAVSDPERIIAGGLTTVGSGELVDFIRNYASKEDVGVVVVGYPRNDNGTDSASMEYIKQFLNRMRKVMPEMPIEMVDERYTTKMAFQAMLDGGISKKGRNNKNGLVDKVSATIILETYMDMLRIKAEREGTSGE